jgi:acyl-CoA hydrolase
MTGALVPVSSEHYRTDCPKGKGHGRRLSGVPTPTDTYIENRERIQPNQTNNYDSAHGGVVMHLMDEIGAMSAMRFAGEPCVTARVEGLDFRRAIPRGDIAAIEAWVYDAGRTSVKVRLRAHREDPRTGERAQTSGSCFTFVAVDEAGSPVEVPDLSVESARDRDLREEGLAADADAA